MPLPPPPASVRLPSPSGPFAEPEYLTLEDVRASMTTSLFDAIPEGVDFSVAGPYTDQQVMNLIRQASREFNILIKDTLMLTVRVDELKGQDSMYLELNHFPIWSGMTVQLTAPALAGDRQVQVSELLGFQIGKRVMFGVPDRANTFVDVSFNQVKLSAPGALPLNVPLQNPHGQGENVMVYGVDTVEVVLPTSVYPIDPTALIVKYSLGTIQNFTPLIFQRTGYTPVFTKDIPLIVQYTSGYLPGYFPPEVKQAVLQIMKILVLRNRYVGKKRNHTGERSDEMDNQFTITLPPAVQAAANLFDRTKGFI